MLFSLLVALLQPLPGAAQARTGTAIQKAKIEQNQRVATPMLNAAKTTADADAFVGQTVTFEGTLQHCKLAPCVIAEGFIIEPVYVFGDVALKQEWVRQTVRVTGVLERTGRFKAHQDENGMWTQGTGGDVYLFTKPTVMLAP